MAETSRAVVAGLKRNANPDVPSPFGRKGPPG